MIILESIKYSNALVALKSLEYLGKKEKLQLLVKNAVLTLRAELNNKFDLLNYRETN